MLSIKEDKLPLLVEMAIQAEQGGPSRIDDDFERQKQAAVAKLRRKIDAARDLFADGDISREEYVKRKTGFEREIAHWETRTTDTQKAAIELRMRMEVLNMIVTLWDESSDEDRQQLARMIFEEIIYDFDQQRIVDFTLKPWAERFLDLRTALLWMEHGRPHDDDDPGAGDGVPSGNGDDGDSGGSGGEVSDGYRGEKENRSSLKSTSDLCPIGAVGAQNGPAWRTVHSAVDYLLAKLNSHPSPPDLILTTRERNIIIRARHAAGSSQAELARQFGISYQRVHQIVHRRRK